MTCSEAEGRDTPFTGVLLLHRDHNKPPLDTLPGLHSFANGIDRDRPAVRAGLSLPYSSGAVEGGLVPPRANPLDPG